MPKRKTPDALELEESMKELRRTRKKGCRQLVVHSQGENTKIKKERKLHGDQFNLLRSKWG